MSPQSHRPIVCAHRGASAYAPENTLASMRKAMELGAQMAELDVQQTADDRLVVFHDDFLERTSTGRGPLWQKTLAQLSQLDAGGWFDPHFANEPIPTLEQVMNLVRGRMRLNIEIRMHGHERDVAALVVKTIRENRFDSLCIVTSFDRAVADRVKAMAPQLTVGYIFGREAFDPAVFTGPVDVLSAEASLIDESFMQQARNAGKAVHVWTVNGAAEMRRLARLGVDAIITNYPDRL